MGSLPPEVEASYVLIIDNILATSDINKISSKNIRDELQKVVEYDLSPQKVSFKAPIQSTVLALWILTAVIPIACYQEFDPQAL